MALGKTLEIPGAAAATENAKNRHLQQQPLGIAHSSALTPFRQGLQKDDQVRSGSMVGQQIGALLTKPSPGWPHQLLCAGLSVGPDVVAIGDGNRIGWCKASGLSGQIQAEWQWVLSRQASSSPQAASRQGLS